MNIRTHSPIPSRLRRSAAVAAVTVLALLAAACTDGDDPTTTDDPDTGAVTAPDTTLDDPGVGEPEPRHPACEDAVHGLILRAPDGWDATPPDWGEPCRFFDSDGESIALGERPTDDAAISLRVDVGPFEDATPAEAGDADHDVDGREAMRFEEDDSLTWIVDMREGRYLTARADSAGAEVVEVLDEMVASIRWIDPRTAGEGIDPIAPPTETPIASDDFPRLDDDVLVLSDLRSAGQDGFDRVVVELDANDGAAAPSFAVEEVAGPFVDPTTGATTPVEGDVFVEIRLTPATNDLPDGSRAYEGPDRIPSPDSEVIAEVVRLRADGDEERIVVGLTDTVPVAVDTLADPTRLVVDLVHDDDLASDSD